MNAPANILTPSECLEKIRPRCREMLAEVQAMLEGYPLDTRTRGNLSGVRFNLKMILED